MRITFYFIQSEKKIKKTNQPTRTRRIKKKGSLQPLPPRDRSTLWWGWALSSRGGIILTASWRLMFPLGNKILKISNDI